ncbi:MAG: DNA-directed DNA polymerase I, partial [Candidatus Bathyarchaeota archaeon]|nr:DNA-directed DNA polymerase I [Candidatus Bathyarchaeota archaeon]
GRPIGCIRDIIKAWEADIRYAENYIHDRNLEIGMPYEVKDEKLIPSKFELPDNILTDLEKTLEDELDEFKKLSYKWARLLECPVPEFIRASIDIEVYSPIETRIPDPNEAEYPIICISLIGTDDFRQVLLLKRENIPEGSESISLDADIKFFQTEKELLSYFFKCIEKYPIIVTFNGDDFDLRYLRNRAQSLDFEKEQIPIELGRDYATIRQGIHLDLYRFFFNRSIQVYAFGQKYREKSLNEIGSSLLNMGKQEITKPISELTYSELAIYCYRDAEITINLTKFDDSLLIKLMILLARISYMDIEDVTRQGVSGWIRSMLFHEHKKRNYLIPRQDEILEFKGRTVSEAIIKGKKYKGAIVVEPTPGVHFGVSVLDFASLYPSVIKIWNLGYETVNCPHEDEACKNNKVPNMPHWICKKRKALESLLIGSLRDLRVNFYKPKLKDPKLSDNMRSWYRVVSDGLKVVLNASYGVFGADRFALYCPPVAEATAAIGRYVIQNTIDKAQSLGIHVLYGDTDSIFLESSDQIQLKNLIEWSKNSMKLELEVDKEYKYVALSSRKKNYLGVYSDGKVDIKGLTGKKRHTPKFLKNAFYEMIDKLSEVESKEEFEKIKGEIKNIVKKCYLKLKNREYSLEDLAFSIVISKSPKRYTKTTPQHVKAARLLLDKGIDIKRGDLITFVKVVGETGVKPVSLASINEIDSQKYVEYIDSIFDQVFDPMDIDFQELIGTTKLEKFF